MALDRRSFLVSLGAGGYQAVLASNSALAAPRAADIPVRRRVAKPPEFFTPIAPSSADRLILPKGFTADLVIRWNDPIDAAGDERFGFNNDFLAYFPLDALQGGSNCFEGLLWVNHEYPDPLFLSGYSKDDYQKRKRKTVAEVEAERAAVGGCVLHVKQAGGTWKPVIGSRFNCRFSAKGPMIGFSGPAAALRTEARGTLANCSGGRTPWFTALSCEENYPDYNASDPALGEGYRWGDAPGMALDERDYGWIVEIDPFGELPPIKHTALGRFKHENAAVTLAKDGRLVVYMGDDEADQHLYKYVSAEPLPKDAPRAEQRKALERGTLFAADLKNCKWVPLIHSAASAAKIEKSSAYAEAKKKDPSLSLRSQGELLIHARLAARSLGATPLDRCEDCEVHPRDGSLYVALTKNAKHGNIYGHILRLVEDRDDAAATTFEFEIFLAGGPQSGLACPDNLAFDRDGNLWVVCDIAAEELGAGAYKSFGNNGLYVVPTSGPSAGEAFQFASGPVGAELTGPWFSEDYRTLFLSVQHPGENTNSLDKLTSHWPDGGESIPKPSVVAIRGFPG